MAQLATGTGGSTLHVTGRVGHLSAATPSSYVHDSARSQRPRAELYISVVIYRLTEPTRSIASQCTLTPIVRLEPRRSSSGLNTDSARVSTLGPSSALSAVPPATSVSIDMPWCVNLSNVVERGLEMV